MSIPLRRLQAQGLIGRRFATPEEVVSHFGAVQSQDFHAAKWAVAQRTERATDADIERALNEGRILRTHVLRPTWHFVTPADIRWMLRLTAPRVKMMTARYHRKLDIDAKTLERAYERIEETLRGGRHATRAELSKTLAATGTRLAMILMEAELDGLICSGAMRGKQQTWALLEERVAAAPEPSRDEALRGLAGRYFASHAPAQLSDFTWWSGLTMADAKTAAAVLPFEEIAGKKYFGGPAAARRQPTVHLLPKFDEYLIAYSDRSAAEDAAHRGSDDLFKNTVVVDGIVAGTWQRPEKGEISQPSLYAPLGERHQKALEKAMSAYDLFRRGPINSPARID